jgi:hypothetical protein
MLIHQLPVLFFVEDFFVLERSISGINDDVSLEVEYPFELTQTDVEQVANAARQSFEKPDMRAWTRQFDMAQALTPHQTLTFAIFKELVEINTVSDSGDTARAADAMAARLRSGRFAASDVQVFKPAPRKGNLIVRYRGTGGGYFPAGSGIMSPRCDWPPLLATSTNSKDALWIGTMSVFSVE